MDTHFLTTQATPSPIRRRPGRRSSAYAYPPSSEGWRQSDGRMSWRGTPRRSTRWEAVSSPRCWRASGAHTRHRRRRRPPRMTACSATCSRSSRGTECRHSGRAPFWPSAFPAGSGGARADAPKTHATGFRPSSLPGRGRRPQRAKAGGPKPRRTPDAARAWKCRQSRAGRAPRRRRTAGSRRKAAAVPRCRLPPVSSFPAARRPSPAASAAGPMRPAYRRQAVSVPGCAMWCGQRRLGVLLQSWRWDPAWV